MARANESDSRFAWITAFIHWTKWKNNKFSESWINKQKIIQTLASITKSNRLSAERPMPCSLCFLNDFNVVSIVDTADIPQCTTNCVRCISVRVCADRLAACDIIFDVSSYTIFFYMCSSSLSLVNIIFIMIVLRWCCAIHVNHQKEIRLTHNTINNVKLERKLTRNSEKH